MDLEAIRDVVQSMTAEKLKSITAAADEAWVLYCTALVFFMQAGFCCYEAGLSRSKNSIDVACKNIFDFCVAGLVFWTVGFGLMFGDTQGGLFGSGTFLQQAQTYFFWDPTPGHWPTIFFFFQLAYCGASITIVSGAVGERLRFVPYLIIAALVAAVIYPLFGHWAWAGFGTQGAGGEPDPEGWLGKLGFTDFAGSTVVNSLGAWVALAGVLVVGPRLGKFPDAHGRSRWAAFLALVGFKRLKYRGPVAKIHGHNLSFAALGLFILWFGFFGFTGGRTYAPNAFVPVILVNTLLAGISGGFGGLTLSLMMQHKRVEGWLRRARFRVGEYNPYDKTVSELTEGQREAKFSLEHIMNGVVAGLVAVCASCNVISHGSAIVIGLAAAVVMHLASWVLEHVFWLDDVSGAIATHGFAGVWGTLAVPLFIREELLEIAEVTRISLLGSQVLGVSICFVWGFVLSFGAFWLMKHASERHSWLGFLRVRPRKEDEELGMNITEHGASTEHERVIAQLNAFERGQEVPELPVHEFTEMRLVVEVLNRLSRARREFEAGQAKEEFLQSMSHEIRTPVTAILGYAEELEQQLRDLGETGGMEDAQRIVRQGNYLLQLLNDILDLAKIDAGMLSIKVERLCLPELIEEVMDQMSLQSSRKDLNFRATQKGAIPRVIQSDKTRVRQILVNLLSNAIKFTEAPGSVQLVTRIAESTSIPMIQFDVVDTGVGMDEEEQNRLFRPFTQLDATKGGTGLGLTITKRLTEKLQGSIRVESKKREGSKFTVRLPCGSLDDVAMVADLDVARAETRRHRLAEARMHRQFQGRILLVEDVEENQRMIRRKLERAGAEVTLADNGFDGMVLALSEWALGRAFDVILMDVRMPVMDGYQATLHLRAAGYPGPIVALTAHALSDERERAADAGCDAFVTKPLPPDLIDMLRHYGPRKTTNDKAGLPRLYSIDAADPDTAEDIAAYLERIPERVASMNDAVRRRKWETLEELAHPLKGTLPEMGFHHITPTAAALLRAIRARASDAEIGAKYSDFVDLLQRLSPGVPERPQ